VTPTLNETLLDALRNRLAGWVMTTGWAKASEGASHPSQTLTTMLLK
jgi:hypothetical protein